MYALGGDSVDLFKLTAGLFVPFRGVDDGGGEELVADKPREDQNDSRQEGISELHVYFVVLLHLGWWCCGLNDWNSVETCVYVGGKCSCFVVGLAVYFFLLS